MTHLLEEKGLTPQTADYPPESYWAACDKLVGLKIFDTSSPEKVVINKDTEKRVKERTRRIKVDNPRMKTEMVLMEAILLEIIDRVDEIDEKDWSDMANTVLAYIKVSARLHSLTLDRWLSNG